MKPKQSVINSIEAMAAINGCLLELDDEYYDHFLRLSQQDVEQLTVMILMNQSKSIRQITGGQSTPDTVERTAEMLNNIVLAMGMGLTVFNLFGQMTMTARVGKLPTDEIHDAVKRKCAQIKPIITNTVRQTLPWFLSRDMSQGQLPL